MLFIFDMGGVVTNTFNFNVIYEKIGITKNIFFEICKHKNDIWSKLEKGKISVPVFWNSFNEEIEYLKTLEIPEQVIQDCNKNCLNKINAVENDLFRLYFHPSKNMETVEIIKNLKKNHRVVCGTNTIESHWENHMERGDYAFFNQTYPSNKIGEAKPNPNFFKLILEAENSLPENTFFVDDKIENVLAAKSVGIHGVQFTTAEKLACDIKTFLEK